MMAKVSIGVITFCEVQFPRQGEHNGAFWGSGYVLYLDLGHSYMREYVSKNPLCCIPKTHVF